MAYYLVRPEASEEDVRSLLTAIQEHAPGARLETHAASRMIHVPGPALPIDWLVPEAGDRRRLLVAPVEPGPRGGMPVFPHFALLAAAGGLLSLAVLIGLAAFFPPGLGEPADVHSPPPAMRPDWYFLAFHAVRTLIPERLTFVGYFGLLAACLVALFWPFLDRTQGDGLRSRWLPLAIGWLILLSILALSLKGYFG